MALPLHRTWLSPALTLFATVAQHRLQRSQLFQEQLVFACQRRPNSPTAFSEREDNNDFTLNVAQWGVVLFRLMLCIWHVVPRTKNDFEGVQIWPRKIPSGPNGPTLKRHAQSMGVNRLCFPTLHAAQQHFDKFYQWWHISYISDTQNSLASAGQTLFPPWLKRKIRACKVPHIVREVGL